MKTQEITSFTRPITWLKGIDTGWGNGYVAVPEGHPWFGKGYDDIAASVHGGLTYAEGEIIDQPEETKGMWIVGFDCAHLGDNKETCPKEYVEAETESLKQQALTAAQ